MAGKVLWAVLGCAIGACGGHASTSTGQAAGGSEPREQGPKAAGQPAVEPREPALPNGAAPAVGGMATGTETEESAGAPNVPTVANGGATSAQAGAGGVGPEPIAFPPRSVCGPEESEYTKRFCPNLEMVSIDVDTVQDAGGDGEVSPGETGYVVFTLRYDGPERIVNDTCVGLLPAIPGLTVLESFNPALKIYGVSAGIPATVKMRFRVEEDVPPGTRIPLLGWLDIHGALCPNGDELRFDLVVAR